LKPTFENLPRLKAIFDDIHKRPGWTDFKKQLKLIHDIALANYELDYRCSEEKRKELCLNRCLFGNPGTGKTTAAKFYAEILKELRLLNKGEVFYKTASDFIGAAVGATPKNTNAILEYAKGSVLVIDEAYNLDDQMYGKEVRMGKL